MPQGTPFFQKIWRFNILKAINIHSNDLLVLRFNTASGNQYLYDAVSNRVFSCPDVFIEILKKYRGAEKEQIVTDLKKKFAKKTIEFNYNRISNYVEQDHCFFRVNSNIKSDASEFAPLEEEYWQKLFFKVGCNQMILVLTENCNMRCRYCAYSGHYTHQRTHSSTKMNFETAKAAINYFHELHSRTYVPLPTPFITFYGGEPLLQFNLIQKCVEYAKSSETNDVKFKFNLTTNGTLLSKEKIDFFIANQVGIMVSLDGSKETHDKNRIWPTGKGTFDKIMASLQAIRHRDPDYYREHVLVATTYDQRTDMIELNRFFIKNKEQLPIAGFANPVIESETTYYDDLTQEERNEFRQQIQNLIQIYYDTKVKKADQDIHFIERIFPTFALMTRRNYLCNPFDDWYTSACFPGMKLATHPDGSLHMCERINSHFPIGDCWNGLDFGKIKGLMQAYYEQIIAGKCYQCIAQRFCQVCWANAGQDDGFSTGKICQENRQNLPLNLSLLYSILEENPHAFDDVTLPFETNSFLWNG